MLEVRFEKLAYCRMSLRDSFTRIRLASIVSQDTLRSFMNTNVTPDRIMQFAWGYAPTLIIQSALQHRIFDLLDQSPKTVDELAQATAASKRGLTAILNAL